MLLYVNHESYEVQKKYMEDNRMTVKELLPIGSVVWLKDAQHALMIFGVKQTNKDDGVEYDYIGVPFPEGNMGFESQLLFNHVDIEKTDFEGCRNESHNEFIEKLNEFYKQDQQG